jgi:hypothetical protein
VRRRARALTLLCLLLPTALCACGSQAPAVLDASDALALQRTIAAVRTSAGRGERAAAVAGLEGLRARIKRLAAAGKLAHAQEAALGTGVAQALAAARRELQPPAPIEASGAPAASATPAPPPPPARHKENKPGKQPGHGHAKHGGGGGE